MLCKTSIPVVTAQPFTSIPLSVTTYSMRVFSSVQQLDEDWMLAQPANNEFLHPTYLSVVEQYPPEDFKFRYLVFYKHRQPIGVAYTQVVCFSASRNIKSNHTPNGWLSKMQQKVKERVAKRVEANCLFCGNLLLTGKHGYHFQADVTDTVQVDLLTDALIKLNARLDEEGLSCSATFIKDFHANESQLRTGLQQDGYMECEFLPNMKMPIRDHWHTMDDYTDSFTSKYRVRYRRARKKMKGITRKIFHAEHIRANQARIHELYLNIAEAANFNMALLHPRYFLGLKEAFGEQFTFTAYYDGATIVGYTTTFKNGAELEAHFLGFDRAYNRSHQLYLNMLYDMVAQAIEGGVRELVFARTAMEIKSSVGAVADQMFCYLRHRNDLSNKLMVPVVNYLTPAEEWQARHPFKEGV